MCNSSSVPGLKILRPDFPGHDCQGSSLSYYKAPGSELSNRHFSDSTILLLFYLVPDICVH